jgi:hypothetical protein
MSFEKLKNKPIPGSYEAIIWAHKKEIDELNRSIKFEKFERKSKKPLSFIGGVVLFLGGLVLGDSFLHLGDASGVKPTPAQIIEKNLTRVSDLEASGACPSNLSAEATLFNYENRNSNKVDPNNYYLVMANEYQKAEVLSQINIISCTPKNPNAPNLTPDFNVHKMQEKHDCAQKINQDIESTTGLSGAELIAVENHNKSVQIMSNLAIEYSISCS